jgi:regulatory protein
MAGFVGSRKVASSTDLRKPGAREQQALASAREHGIVAGSMAIITGLVPSPDIPGHVVLLVDGVPFATIPAKEAETLGLREGESAAATAAPGPIETSTRTTYERALSLLSYRDRSVKELQKRLHEKGEAEDRIAPTIERLQQSGLLDDSRFAAERARAGLVGKARSRRQIEHDLALRGVTREVASAAIQQVLAEEGTSELEVAVRAARKKAKSLERMDPQAQRQKLYAFLARQGYTPDLVRRAMRAALDAAPPEGADE